LLHKVNLLNVPFVLTGCGAGSGWNWRFVVLMSEYWSVSQVACDVLCRLLISWYMGLCLLMCCSGMSGLCRWY